jgi:hypothetical protein
MHSSLSPRNITCRGCCFRVPLPALQFTEYLLSLPKCGITHCECCQSLLFSFALGGLLNGFLSACHWYFLSLAFFVNTRNFYASLLNFSACIVFKYVRWHFPWSALGVCMPKALLPYPSLFVLILPAITGHLPWPISQNICEFRNP